MDLITDEIAPAYFANLGLYGTLGAPLKQNSSDFTRKSLFTGLTECYCICENSCINFLWLGAVQSLISLG